MIKGAQTVWMRALEIKKGDGMILNLNEHIEKSFQRLSSEDYSIGKIWKDGGYGWPADWEGRALLAFVCLFEVQGKKIPCMDLLIKELPNRMNGRGYMGSILSDGTADEQQLSGHSWMLRGLVAYYRMFGNTDAALYAKSIVENLFLPCANLYASYPVESRSLTGGVSGCSTEMKNGWLLSSDIGCAFMCMDGLSAYYEMTEDVRVKETFDRLAEGFMRLDRMRMQCQTHATLSAARGLMRMFRCTGNEKYFQSAKEVFSYYIQYGMTLTFENFNWFGREKSWTEPCAVTDSFILALWFWEITREDCYRTLASRIWYNGLTFCHRENGGAGPNECVTSVQPYLSVNMYEAPFCCTMRYCEALVFAKKYEKVIESSDGFYKDGFGRLFWGNRLLAEDSENKFPQEKRYLWSGKEFIAIPSFPSEGKYKLKIIDGKR